MERNFSLLVVWKSRKSLGTTQCVMNKPPPRGSCYNASTRSLLWPLRT